MEGFGVEKVLELAKEEKLFSDITVPSEGDIVEFRVYGVPGTFRLALAVEETFGHYYLRQVYYNREAGLVKESMGSLSIPKRLEDTKMEIVTDNYNEVKEVALKILKIEMEIDERKKRQAEEKAKELEETVPKEVVVFDGGNFRIKMSRGEFKVKRTFGGYVVECSSWFELEVNGKTHKFWLGDFIDKAGRVRAKSFAEFLGLYGIHVGKSEAKRIIREIVRVSEGSLVNCSFIF